MPHLPSATYPLLLGRVSARNELGATRAILREAAWGDGRVTAGVQSAMTGLYHNLLRAWADV